MSEAILGYFIGITIAIFVLLIIVDNKLDKILEKVSE